MNRQIRTYAAPLLLCAGVAFSQPTWDEGESFDDFREEWNGWAESLPTDQRMHFDLTAVTEQIWGQERNLKLSKEIGEWPHHVLTGARPWDGHWALIDRVRKEFRSELDMLYNIVQRPHFGAPIPTVWDGSGRVEPKYPSEWVTEYSSKKTPSLRLLIDTICGDATYLAMNDHPDIAVERFQLAARLNQLSIELPGEVDYLSYIPIKSVVEQAIVDLVQYEPDVFSDVQLAEMQSIFMKHLQMDGKHVFEMKRKLVHEDWSQQYSDSHDVARNRDLRQLYHNQASMFVAEDINRILQVPIQPELDIEVPLATLEQQIELYTRVHQAMMADLIADPKTQRLPQSSVMIRSHLRGEDASRYVPVFFDTALFRSHLGVLHRYNYETANQIAVISIYRHRVRHGDWPSSLAEIDPKVLPIPAIDYYSGDPLRYTLINGEPRLWALGADRDDDGGRPVPREEHAPNPGWTWFALDEWDALSDEERAEYDGDLRILN